MQFTPLQLHCGFIYVRAGLNNLTDIKGYNNSFFFPFPFFLILFLNVVTLVTPKAVDRYSVFADSAHMLCPTLIPKKHPSLSIHQCKNQLSE